MFETCFAKQTALLKQFGHCTTAEEIYQKIIELGRHQPSLDIQYKIEKNLVKGCQSLMYLHSEYRDGHMYFQAASDALISAGLAALLISVYNEETPETILKCSPTYLKEIGLTHLSPGRANGLASMHLRMKQEALRHLQSFN